MSNPSRFTHSKNKIMISLSRLLCIFFMWSCHQLSLYVGNYGNHWMSHDILRPRCWWASQTKQVASIKLALSYFPFVKSFPCPECLNGCFSDVWWEKHEDVVGQVCHISRLAPYWLSHFEQVQEGVQKELRRSAGLVMSCQKTIKGPHTCRHTQEKWVSRNLIYTHLWWCVVGSC